MVGQPKYGVLLANTGTPSAPRPRAVRKYLSRFLMEKRIVPMNRALWWPILHFFILPSRGRASAQKYAAVWTDEGSPLLVAHDRLANGLQRSFEESGLDDIAVAYGMSFGEPSIDAALLELRRAGCEKLLVLPLYPQSTYSTTGVVYDHVERCLDKLKWDVECHLIDNYHDDPTYVKAIAASLSHAGFGTGPDDRVVFSYHSIPLKDIEAGDTYELQCGASSLQIASELGLGRKQWTIGYQCVFDKGRQWLSPYTQDVLDRWAEAGAGRVFVVCPGFAVDCLETLYDVTEEMQHYYLVACSALGAPAREEDFVYVPCLDKSKAHLKVLRAILDPYLEG
ncbi:MAG: ferrochelatase [Eggerthellaceae bacterium]|nr:ferrochelatase [Eggerthellaceae bacterium]